MGSETPETQSTQAQETSAQTPASITGQVLTNDVGLLHAKVAELEAKLKKVENETVAAVQERLRQVEAFLKSKYPYSL